MHQERQIYCTVPSLRQLTNALHCVFIKSEGLCRGVAFDSRTLLRLHRAAKENMADHASIPPLHPSGSTGAHLSITVEELMQPRLVTRGSLPPTLIVRGGLVLSLHTGEILSRGVVVHSRHIAAIAPCGHYPAAPKEISAHGKFVPPGFIDAHIHVEYTKLIPGELARLSIPKGTTTILADANCIENVLGGRGMDFMGKIFHLKLYRHRGTDS